MPYREKRIFSGRYLEIEIYPISLQEKKKTRKEKLKATKPKQRNLNDKNAKKHLIRLINTNFDNRDLAVHLTYDDEHLPRDEDQARRDIANYIRRVKGHRKRSGLPALKYIAVIECKTPTPGHDGIRIHHHIIMSGGIDRDAAEQLWGKGRANADRLKADESGYEGLARYITKDPRGSKRWSQSKNLAQPRVQITDSKWSKRRVERISHERDEEHFKSEHPGYALTEWTQELNDICGGIYMCIKMRRLEGVNRKE